MKDIVDLIRRQVEDTTKEVKVMQRLINEEKKLILIQKSENNCQDRKNTEQDLDFRSKNVTFLFWWVLLLADFLLQQLLLLSCLHLLFSGFLDSNFVLFLDPSLFLKVRYLWSHSFLWVLFWCRDFSFGCCFESEFGWFGG